jgi:hypothetical protein
MGTGGELKKKGSVSLTTSGGFLLVLIVARD